MNNWGLVMGFELQPPTPYISTGSMTEGRELWQHAKDKQLHNSKSPLGDLGVKC